MSVIVPLMNKLSGDCIITTAIPSRGLSSVSTTVPLI